MTIQLTDKVSTTVDDDVFDSVKDYRWRYNNVTGYAYGTVGTPRRTVYLHRVILGITDRNTYVDHINGDKLDNRKCNIRAVTRSQNQQNQKIHRDGKLVGVHHQDGKIGALIVFGGKLRWLGYWETETKAGEAYKLARTLLEGGFETTNVRSEVKRRLKVD